MTNNNERELILWTYNAYESGDTSVVFYEDENEFDESNSLITVKAKDAHFMDNYEQAMKVIKEREAKGCKDDWFIIDWGFSGYMYDRFNGKINDTIALKAIVKDTAIFTLITQKEQVFINVKIGKTIKNICPLGTNIILTNGNMIRVKETLSPDDKEFFDLHNKKKQVERIYMGTFEIEISNTYLDTKKHTEIPYYKEIGLRDDISFMFEFRDRMYHQQEETDLFRWAMKLAQDYYHNHGHPDSKQQFTRLLAKINREVM